MAFRVAAGAVAPSAPAAAYQVDAIAGATMTTNAVTAMVHYWFGPHGFDPFLNNLRDGEAGR